MNKYKGTGTFAALILATFAMAACQSSPARDPAGNASAPSVADNVNSSPEVQPVQTPEQQRAAAEQQRIADEQEAQAEKEEQQKAQQADAAAQLKISALFQRMHVTLLGDMTKGCEEPQASDTNVKGYLVQRDRDQALIQTCINVTVDGNTNDVSIDIATLNFQTQNPGNPSNPSP